MVRHTAPNKIALRVIVREIPNLSHVSGSNPVGKYEVPLPPRPHSLGQNNTYVTWPIADGVAPSKALTIPYYQIVGTLGSGL